MLCSKEHQHSWTQPFANEQSRHLTGHSSMQHIRAAWWATATAMLQLMQQRSLRVPTATFHRCSPPPPKKKGKSVTSCPPSLPPTSSVCTSSCQTSYAVSHCANLQRRQVLSPSAADTSHLSATYNHYATAVPPGIAMASTHQTEGTVPSMHPPRYGNAPLLLHPALSHRPLHSG